MSPIVSAILAEQNTKLARHNSTLIDFKSWLSAGQFQASQMGAQVQVTPFNLDDCIAGFTNEILRLSKAGRETLENVRSNRTANTVHPAWSAIQVYYAAFYYASALLRVVGSSISYFVGPAIHRQLFFYEIFPSIGRYLDGAALLEDQLHAFNAVAAAIGGLISVVLAPDGAPVG